MNGIVGGQMEMPDPIQEALLDEIAKLTKENKQLKERLETLENQFKQLKERLQFVTFET